MMAGSQQSKAPSNNDISYRCDGGFNRNVKPKKDQKITTRNEPLFEVISNS
jgi:hypothetical protein